MSIPTRRFGRTGWDVSEIGFGAWAIGGAWGDVAEEDARRSLHAALDAGMTFIDTADVYGDGRSEQIIRDVLRDRGDHGVKVATKIGRKLHPHVSESYSAEALEAFVDCNLANLGVETIDLVQLHCPPADAYYRPEIFEVMDAIVAAGKVRHFGVSVEKVEEGLKAIAYPGVASVQIIYNMFRQRPAELFLRQAMAQQVAVIARVPLASGMLTGKMRSDTSFPADDHRQFNRDGAAFDIGETFSGVPYGIALAAVEELRPLVPAGWTMAQMALRWILMDDGVSVVIPGAKTAEQAAANAAAASMPGLSDAVMDRIRAIYSDMIAPHVHQRW